MSDYYLLSAESYQWKEIFRKQYEKKTLSLEKTRISNFLENNVSYPHLRQIPDFDVRVQ
jgi:hypothetical protein